MEMRIRVAVVLGVIFLMMVSVVFKGTAQDASHVYVTDFVIDQEAQDREDASNEGGLLERLKPGILEDMKEERRELRRDDLIRLLSQSLVDDLNDKGISASRVSGLDELGSQGILVRGEFVKMDDGDPLKRAAVGLQTGATNMEVKVMISKLPLEESQSGDELDLKSSSSGKGPGGILGLAAAGNPYVLAGKFVMAQHTSEQDARKLASQIADEIQTYLQKQ